MKPRPTSAALVDAGALLVLGTLALLGLRNTYAGWSYLLVGGAGLLIGLLLAYALRALGQPVIVVAATVMIAFFVVGDLLVLPDRPAFALSTLHDLAVSAVFGWKQLLTTLPPVPAGDPLLVVPYILGLVCGSVGFLLAQALPPPRRSAGLRALVVAFAAVTVPIAVLATAIAFGTDTPGAELPDGVAFAVLCLCWIAVRRHRTRPLAAAGTRRLARFATAAALLALASLGALLMSPVLPGAHAASRTVLRDEIVPPFDINEYPSPLVGFRKYTKAANNLYDQTLFTVHGLPSGATVRIASLDDYDGYVWGATNDVAGNQFQRVGTIITPAAGATVRVDVTISGAYASQPDLSAWLPDAGTVVSLRLDGVRAGSTLHFNRGANDAVVTGRLRAGDHYTFDTVATTAKLPDDVQPYGVPALTENAQSLLGARIPTWTSGAVGLGPQLNAVATYLRNNGRYSDGGANETQYLPGHSLGRLSAFVNGPQIVGDDEQYAATYALVANDLGIPARVVFGARPEADGTVRGQDIHAWVEVHLADGSWVRIPETQFMPDQSRKPDVQPPQETQNVKAAVVPPPNAVHKPTSVTDSQSNETVIPPRPPHKPSLLERIWAILAPVLPWTGPPVLVALLLAGAVLGWKWRRRKRRRTTGPTANRYAGGWRELVDLARDAGVDMPVGRTRQQQADLLLSGAPRQRRARGRHRGAGPLGRLPLGRIRRRPGPAVPDLAATVPIDATVRVDPLYPSHTATGIRVLADAADLAVYGPDDPSDDAVTEYWEGVDRMRRAMICRYGWGRRMVIRLSVTSVRPAVRQPQGIAAPPSRPLR
jgi:hypothetical protein